MGTQQSRRIGQLLAMAPHLNRSAGSIAANQRNLFIEKDLVEAHKAHSCFKRGRGQSLGHMWLGSLSGDKSL